MGAQGLTFLQIVNRVLARLREASVAANTETIYSTFIGTLVNQVKNEIEKAYLWNALRDTFSISTVAGTTSYTFTGAGSDASVIGDGWETTSPAPILRATNKNFDEWYFGVKSADIQSGAPRYFVPAGLSANYDLKMDVFPKPDAVYTMVFNVYKPQADLSNDADVALIPQSVLIEEVIARAQNERGDDMAPKPAQPGDSFIMRELLDDAIARESGQDPTETDWEAE